MSPRVTLMVSFACETCHRGYWAAADAVPSDPVLCAWCGYALLIREAVPMVDVGRTNDAAGGSPP